MWSPRLKFCYFERYKGRSWEGSCEAKTWNLTGRLGHVTHHLLAYLNLTSSRPQRPVVTPYLSLHWNICCFSLLRSCHITFLHAKKFYKQREAVDVVIFTLSGALYNVLFKVRKVLISRTHYLLEQPMMHAITIEQLRWLQILSHISINIVPHNFP